MLFYPLVIAQFRGPYRFLSNFYPADFEAQGYRFPTVEHAFQAAKAGRSGEFDWVRSAPSPGEAKRRGRRVWLRPDWERVKLELMHELVRAKFTQNPELMRRLQLTGDALLVEGNTWNDTTWGVDLRTGRGENHLGRILMEVRQ